MRRPGNASPLVALGIAASFVAFGCGPQPRAEDDGIDQSDSAPDIERPPVTYFKDGSVLAGETRFATVVDFQRGEGFRKYERRCAAVEPPQDQIAFDPSDCSFNFTSIQPEYQPDAIYEIPVVFHVIQKNSGEGFISEDLLRSQIDVLNEDFQALAGTLGENGTAGAIRFVLASEDPNGNPTTGINYHTNNQWFTDPGPGAANDMKEALAWDTTRYFNIYTNNASGALGYATFPSQSAGTVNDGIVLLWTSVGRNAPQGGLFNLGRTATHEVGHYLGLFHTFQDGCDSGSPYGSGDRIADTVAHPSPDFQCNPGPSSCGGGDKPIENYMNYTNDACMTGFSPEQVNRMRCSLIHYRADLFTVVGGGGGNLPPTADFDHSASELSVDFTDASSDSDGTIVEWQWEFGDGDYSTSQNPSHTYDAAGTYLVTLTVTDDGGDSATTTAEVTVEENGGGGGSGVLESGVPVTGLGDDRGGELHFSIEVAGGATGLKIQLAGNDGDADLYVRYGAPPTRSDWDFRPYIAGSNEVVDIADPEAGTWYVMVRGYTAYSDATLTATIAEDSGGAQEAVVEDLSGADDSQAQYYIDIPAGARNLTFSTTGGTGDVDLYVRFGAEATLSDWDYRPYRYGNEESVQIANPDAGRYFIMLHAYEAYADVTLRVSYE